MAKGTVTVRHDRCKRCGICVAVCPVKNLEFAEGRVAALDLCTACMQCELHCPDFAITVVRHAAPTGAETETVGQGR